MKHYKPILGLALLLIPLISVYAYMYLTLPQLKERFEMEHTDEQALQKETAKLKKQYMKNLHEERMLRKELDALKKQVKIQSKQKDDGIHKQKLLEFDIEKSLANYNKVQIEVDAMKSYYASLQKTHLQTNAELNALKEAVAMDKQKLGTMETNRTKLLQDLTTVSKEKESTTIQIKQLKLQSDLMTTKKDPKAETLKLQLAAMQTTMTEQNNRFVELNARLRFEDAMITDLRNKMTEDLETLAKLKAQYDLDERQLVQTEMKFTNQEKTKQRLLEELKQIKESIAIKDCSNRSLQKTIAEIRTKYNHAQIHNSEVRNNMNVLRKQTIDESLKIKKLQDTVDSLKKSTC
jgi:chromosome segregation ATPase